MRGLCTNETYIGLYVDDSNEYNDIIMEENSCSSYLLKIFLAVRALIRNILVPAIVHVRLTPTRKRIIKKIDKNHTIADRNLEKSYMNVSLKV